MKSRVSRRDCLERGALLAATSALALGGGGCSEAVRRYTVPPTPKDAALPPAGPVDPAARLLNRAAFGPAPGDVARVTRIGAKAYVDEQLAPSEDEPAVLTLRLRTMIGEVRDVSGSGLDLRDLPESDVLRQLSQIALLKAAYSRNQLRERMADFWSNHFNVYARKNRGVYLSPRDEAGIRPHVLGNFSDLVRASAHSPAMLGYLDNEANRKGVPNENYAREILELHTVGVDGGYTQKDVEEVARCLTGWTTEDRFLHRKGTFRFDESRHDNGPKRVLGHVIPAGGGESDGDRVLEIVSRHPATARHIAAKLCRYFLGESSDEAKTWTPKLAALFTRTNGDIKAMLRPLLLSDELRHGPPILKRPLDFVASSLRALNADTDGGLALQGHLSAMGQPLHEWPLPDGYPDTTHAWAGSLLARWNFAFALTGGQIQGTRVADLPGLVKAATGDDAGHADALLALILARRSAGDEALRGLRHTVAGYLSRAGENAERALPEAAGLCLAAPQFQWR